MTTIISSKTVLHTKLFDVKEIKLQYQNGNRVIHHAAERKKTAIVFPLTDNYELYLVRQYRYLLKKTTIEAVAGYFDAGETPLQCAKRELSEEGGITALQWELLLQTQMGSSVFEAKEYLFLAKELELGKAHPDEGEEITLIKMPLEKAVEKVFLGEINNSGSIIGIMILDRLRREKKL